MDASSEDAMNVETKLLPKLAYREVQIGKIIGRGGFSVVSEVARVDLDDVYDTDEEQTRLRRAFSSSCNDRSEEKPMFVMKLLRTDLPEEEKKKGIVDLGIEAEFLSQLSHPNIISMRGMANTDPDSTLFFILLDRLVFTLDRRFNYWRKVVGANSGIWAGPCLGYCCAKSFVLHDLWVERLKVARDIAKAVAHLHAQNIVYRDLKPDNIGFTHLGIVKIFDFGLAKKLDPSLIADNDLYNLTGNTGSLRYMAPEVAIGLPYNQKADSYSYGILFWQICSLTTPYFGFGTKMHAERVVKQDTRPKPDRSWPQTWTDLMEKCWIRDLKKRPTFEKIAQVMEDQVFNWKEEDGIVPTRASEIRAKKRKKKARSDATGPDRLDVDTRISHPADTNVKRFDASVV